MTSQLIRNYYRCFNERRMSDAAALFAADAVVDMPPFVQRAHGSGAYAHFADTWLRAFPDAVFTLKHVEQRRGTMCDVCLIATGTHTGLLDLGTYGVLQPSGVRLTLQLRELLDIRNRTITYSHLSFDIDQLVREITQVDYLKLMAYLATVRDLSASLAQAQGDVARQRDVMERLGRALDAARHAARPEFKR